MRHSRIDRERRILFASRKSFIYPLNLSKAARFRPRTAKISHSARPIFHSAISCDRETRMDNASHRVGFLAAMICMIMLFAVPSRAYAHAGHGSHGAGVIAASTSASESVAATERLQRPAANLQLFLSAAEPETGESESSSGCVGKCCTASHACCAFTLSNPATGDGPVWTRAQSYSATMPVPNGHDPTALRKPPRLFA